MGKEEKGVRLTLAAAKPMEKERHFVKLPLFDKKGGKKVRVPADIAHRLDECRRS
jgi:hypothetical protein